MKEKKSWQETLKQSIFLRGVLLLLAVYVVLCLLSNLMYIPILSSPPSCLDPRFTCMSNNINEKTGELDLEVIQNTNKTIRVNGVACAQTNLLNSPKYLISYGDSHSVTIPPQGRAFIAKSDDSERQWLRIICTDANGNAPPNMDFTAQLFINYTEMDTGNTRILSSIRWPGSGSSLKNPVNILIIIFLVIAGFWMFSDYIFHKPKQA